MVLPLISFFLSFLCKCSGNLEYNRHLFAFPEDKLYLFVKFQQFGREFPISGADYKSLVLCQEHMM